MIIVIVINIEIFLFRIGIVGILDVYRKCEYNFNNLYIFLDF